MANRDRGVTVAHSTLRRSGRGVRRVTNVELFFDLVYAFAVTQLSRYLTDHATIEGALQTALLVAMVWLVWAYTGWLTNFLDPDRTPMRFLLLGLALVSLVMSAGLPDAFGQGGLAVGAAYAAMQIGRSVFAVRAMRGDHLQKTFQRILVWCLVSGTFAVAGGLAQGHARELLWVLAAGTDLLGGATRFYTPGLGRSETREWDIDALLFAERCQSFLLIALGESIIAVGTTLTALHAVTPIGVVALLVAFGGSVMIWWVYFDRGPEAAAQVIAASSDPGRIGQIAYHLVHPLLVAGIIAFAAGQRTVIPHPLDPAGGPAALMILGGPAIYLAGHSVFKAQLFHTRPWTRLAAIVVLLGAALAGPGLPALGVAGFAAAVLLAVAIADPLIHPQALG